jgi:phosphatidylserine/phosphatidylglycerophosphate/cardiolipin synthase-like enzyme
MKNGAQIVAALRQLSTPALEKICSQAETDSHDVLHDLANAMLVSEDRTALYRIASTGQSDVHTSFVVGAASALLLERQAHYNSQLVLSGPETDALSVRDTAGVVTQLITSARQECLLLSYAVSHADIPLDLLTHAAHSGVSVTCVLDLAPLANTSFATRSALKVLQAAGAEILYWTPANGAASSMHAKAIVADRTLCLVTSANLTGRALTDNIEIGVLLDDPTIADGIVAHYHQLRQAGWLTEFNGC